MRDRIIREATKIDGAPDDLAEYEWVDLGADFPIGHASARFKERDDGRLPIVGLEWRVEVAGVTYNVGWNKKDRAAGYSEQSSLDHAQIEILRHLERIEEEARAALRTAREAGLVVGAEPMDVSVGGKQRGVDFRFTVQFRNAPRTLHTVLSTVE